ncbi:hypothetical protein GCM10011613_11800 [Cellvibrio zantedeschiae]|uniref:Outer membrane lipoprotein-sorting protein n=1 Tax=Cellvibrio zantedeschiae TaxID=1237077 RepID=A0ABQ3AWQ5_9GAMM|nr:hypothetical protein [Cellvibrio zantedeschiae]GGY69126.1 hypothetical protein GCM10011613_11800 [Cellvibrio zantedeschiae]
MKKILVCVGILFLAKAAIAAPLSAIMTFESMTLTSDGVKKQTQFQERFIRDTNVIWTERIVPMAVHHDHVHEPASDHEHHHDLNFATAGKWIVRDNNNQIKFAFVRSDEKKIIAPRVSEYGTLGFDGEWETAYYLVNRAALKKMQILKKSSAEGTNWYEKKDATQFTRILWDERKEIPLSIETTRFDGTMSNKITLALTPAPLTLPWSKLAAYQTIAYEDLLD